MATVASGLNSGSGFGSSDTITQTTLNNHVNSATVTAIANADVATNAAIAVTKLATITTSNVLGSLGSGNVSIPIIGTTGILKNDDALGTSDTIGATQGNIKAYVDSSFNIASTTKVTASEISSNSENSYVDIPDMEVAITAKRGSSSYLVSGVLSWNSNASNTESIFKVQYKIGSGAYQDFLLPTGASSRQTGHFGLCNPTSNGSQMFNAGFSIMLPSSVEDVSAASVVTFKLLLCSYLRNGSVFINRTTTDTDNNDHCRGVSTITVQEI